MDDVFRRAKDRFRRCEEWESYARRLFMDDLKFANADSDNKYQWPTRMWTDRERDERPALTVNKVRQHNLNIINDAKMNKPAIKFRAAGNGATVEAARVWDGIARQIEYQSNATAHYDHATGFQVTAGVGYLRVLTDYVSDDSFDQDIYITSVADPLGVYLDPDAKAPAKEDARFGFIFEDMPREVFELKYPQYKHLGNEGIQDGGWSDKDHVRVAEYYEAEDQEDELILIDSTPIHVSDLRKLDQKSEYLKDKTLQRRPVIRRTFKYYFIVGNQVVPEETKVWPGKWIPIIPVIGEETVIDGRMDRKGHTRAMKDPQRMYNYWASAAVEYGALQTKTPWLVGIESMEGFETYWANANRQNQAYLPYRSVGDDGKPLPPPSRVEPPVPSPVALKGMELANIELQMVSGQYENQLGQQGNERTGRAIAERQRQGDKATYHFIDNLAIAIRQVGKIILDLVPKIYDTQRVMTILAENQESLDVKLDPMAKQAFQVQLNEHAEVVGRILNPAIGKYEVMADVGPGYATRREEAFNALTLILTQNPGLTGIIGDIMFRAGDFPMAEEAAERLKRMVPPQALGQGPTPTEQALQQQVGQLQVALQAAMDELTKEKGKSQARLEKREVEVYDAITKRLQVVQQGQTLRPDQQALVADEAVRESTEVPISDTYEGHEHPGALEEHEMPEGSFRGADGQIYAEHPEMPGVMARVTKEI